MKKTSCFIAAAIAAASIAACDRNPVPPPSVPKPPSGSAPAAPATPATNFQSSVAPDAATGVPQAADKELSSKVRNALTSTNALEIGGVEVAAANGVVTLYGTVQVPAEKDRAAILALGIEGVRSVVNNLVVIRGS